MNALDAARVVLVAHARVVEAIKSGANREATPADLGAALVALGSAVDVMRRALELELPPCCCLHRGHLERACTHEGCPCLGWHSYDPDHYHTAQPRPRRRSQDGKQ
jgi:hypothetical protein